MLSVNTYSVKRGSSVAVGVRWTARRREQPINHANTNLGVSRKHLDLCAIELPRVHPRVLHLNLASVVAFLDGHERGCYGPGRQVAAPGSRISGTADDGKAVLGLGQVIRRGWGGRRARDVLRDKVLCSREGEAAELVPIQEELERAVVATLHGPAGMAEGDGVVAPDAIVANSVRALQEQGMACEMASKVY